MNVFRRSLNPTSRKEVMKTYPLSVKLENAKGKFSRKVTMKDNYTSKERRRT